MPYELIDHQADVGLQATGGTLEEALSDGVRGMLALMVDPDSVGGTAWVTVQASGSDPGALFVDLLNAVLAAKDIHDMFFHDITIDKIEEQDSGWRLAATLHGEPIDVTRHVIDSDIKAATYGGLRVQYDENGCLLRCVLDL